MLCIFFFFKQKTAYEMRISDWSSDVCSSDLIDRYEAAGPLTARLEAALHDLDFGGGPAGALLGREVRITAGLDGDLQRLLRLAKLTVEGAAAHLEASAALTESPSRLDARYSETARKSVV